MDPQTKAQFAQKSDDFLTWFKNQPGAYFHPDLEIADLRDRNAGRGIIAKADIPPNTTLFTIPRPAILTVENSTLNKTHPDLLSSLCKPTASTSPNDHSGSEDMPDPPDPWLSLILTLLYEHQHASTSPWSPYLAILPTEFSTPMFWPPSWLAELQASAMRSKIGREEADAMFRSTLLPFVREHEREFFPGPDAEGSVGDEEIVALAHRWGSTIMAYAFDLEKEEEEGEGEDGWVEDREGAALGMVPVADLLNADAEFNAHLNHGDDALTMTSLRLIAKGDEVLNYYGPLPNSDLLRRYGYTTEKHALHDVVEVSWDLVLRATKKVLGVNDAVVAAAVEQLDLDELEDSFVLERDPIEPDSTGLLPTRTAPITALPEEMTAQTKRLVKAIKRLKPDAVSYVEASVLEIVSTALGAREQEYATTLEDDRHEVRVALGALRRAIEVRIGEKAILAEMKVFVKERRREMDRGEERGKKRMRIE